MRCLNTCGFIGALCLLLPAEIRADIQSEDVSYKDADVTLKGRIFYDSAVQTKRPGILVVHEWWGHDDHARRAARRLAEAGYVAFALDMYGDGKVTQHPEEAGKWASQIRQNEDGWIQRAQAGLNVLIRSDRVDSKRLAAIGYCFGGSTVIQLALHHAPLAGVVSFHGALPNVNVDEARGTDTKILVCHGSQDTFIPFAQIEAFQKNLNDAEVDWMMITYANARHSFTNPDADARGIEGLRYNESADRRSWNHMLVFFEELFPAKN